LGTLFFREYASALYLFTGALFSLTVVYVFLLKWHFDPMLFAHVQIFADVFLVTLLITLTGWGNSEFSFLYIIPIATTSLFFELRRSVSVALLSSVLYAAAIVFHQYRLSPPLREGGFEVFYSVYIRAIIFCTGGYLCGHLANLLSKSNRELGELKNLHHLILSNMSSGLITTDSQNAVIYANRAAEEVLGLPLTKMYKRSVGELFEAQQGDCLEKVLDDALSDGVSWRLGVLKPCFSLPKRERCSRTPNPRPPHSRELQAKAADGRKIPIGFNISAITNHAGARVGKVMVFSDLTQVKELERRLRTADKFRAAGELAAGIAHEIRNPLASITGSVEMLAETAQLSETDGELLAVVMNESARLNGIIEDFLNYARRGNLDMKKEDLCEIMREAIELLERGGKLLPAVHIELMTPGQKAVVSADRSQMSQVFLNLLSNAADALDGKGRIYVKIESPISTGDHACSVVTVTDTGSGMDQDQLDKVFEPFFTTKKDGVGIGLCIAERIVREHDGHIDIISEKGKGTSVTVVIPAEQGAWGSEPRAWSPHQERGGEGASPLEMGKGADFKHAEVPRPGVAGSKVRTPEKTTVRLSG
jgi:two-component system sensor histidine kinase PilS (NtrC family)